MNTDKFSQFLSQERNIMPDENRAVVKNVRVTGQWSNIMMPT
jgi:hypothetical protein